MSNVYTDEFRSYLNMQDQNHFTVNHSVGKYVDGLAHTNGIESFWSMLKRGYHGTYHNMSHKHLHRYINEFVGRHNIRQNDTIDQMAILFSRMVGKKLPYGELIA